MFYATLRQNEYFCALKSCKYEICQIHNHRNCFCQMTGKENVQLISEQKHSLKHDGFKSVKGFRFFIFVVKFMDFFHKRIHLGRNASIHTGDKFSYVHDKDFKAAHKFFQSHGTFKFPTGKKRCVKSFLFFFLGIEPICRS